MRRNTAAHLLKLFLFCQTRRWFCFGSGIKKLAHWHLLMILLLIETTGWIQRHIGAFLTSLSFGNLIIQRDSCLKLGVGLFLGREIWLKATTYVWTAQLWTQYQRSFTVVLIYLHEPTFKSLTFLISDLRKKLNLWKTSITVVKYSLRNLIC